MALYSLRNKNNKSEGWSTTHFFIQSFENELDSFRAITKYNPERSLVLIDTYNPEEGLQNFIVVAKEIEKTGRRMRAIILDSGDQIEDSKKIRKILDENGLEYIKIFAAGNYDE